MASGERFPAVAAPGRSTGLPRKPQETCHSVPCPANRRARCLRELAEGVRLDSNRRSPTSVVLCAALRCAPSRSGVAFSEATPRQRSTVRGDVAWSRLQLAGLVSTRNLNDSRPPEQDTSWAGNYQRRRLYRLRQILPCLA